MSKVLPSRKVLVPKSEPIDKMAKSITTDFDDLTSGSSILEFLSMEQKCCSDEDAESIFKEVSRLAGNTDTRSVDELLSEAELLIQQQPMLGRKTITSHKDKQPKQNIKLNAKYTQRIVHVRPTLAAKLMSKHSDSTPLLDRSTVLSEATTPVPQTPDDCASGCHFTAFVENLPSESIISEESTPKDMQNFTLTTTAQLNDDNTDDGTDTLEEITEVMETTEMLLHEMPCDIKKTSTLNENGLNHSHAAKTVNDQQSNYVQTVDVEPQLESPTRRMPLNFNAVQECSQDSTEQRELSNVRRASMATPDSGISFSQTTHNYNNNYNNNNNNSNNNNSNCTPHECTPIPCSPFKSAKIQNLNTSKSQSSSPKHMVSTLSSPIRHIANVSREHLLQKDYEALQEKLKDTEERLKSLRIQHDSLSLLQRDLRECNTHLQEESDVLKLDVQHLTECANILRGELKSVRADREEALECQIALQRELDECRQEKKHVLDEKHKDAKTIQDLQRQCREMERILVRKHPDSVSALIVASKNPGMCKNSDMESLSSRKLLEQRIAQLESDAKEQDLKAQQILANVQARFNSVQSKYETHIADLETQVLSLQEINTKLNEKIESQVRTLDYFVSQKAEKYYNNCTQTDDRPQECNINTISTQTIATGSNNAKPTAAITRDHSTNTITNSQHSASSSTSSTANSTPNTSRPNSKQSGLRKPTASAFGTPYSSHASKLPISQSEFSISLSANQAAAKEDAHLLATIRGMRIDLTVREKSIQRLSRELEECKKTIRKLQKEKDAFKADKQHNGTTNATVARRYTDVGHYNDYTSIASTETQALKEAQSKIKLLEADYKSLHDKRLQDLKTLQTAHERELASCHDTVRILQQRLNERDEAFAMQKRRKVPVDYYALKAKVSSLERRHSEREERLHMLVEALSKGRLNGALEDLLGDNNNQ